MEYLMTLAADPHSAAGIALLLLVGVVAPVIMLIAERLSYRPRRIRRRK